MSLDEEKAINTLNNITSRNNQEIKLPIYNETIVKQVNNYNMEQWHVSFAKNRNK